jgi:hypothetical protein
MDAVHAIAIELRETYCRPESYGTSGKKSPARARAPRSEPPSAPAGKKVTVSGASVAPAGREARLVKSASMPAKSQATPAMPIDLATPELRITRILAEGAIILAVHSGKSAIDITDEIVGLLEGK